MVAKPVKSTSLVLSLSAIAQFETHRSVITYVRSLLFGCFTDVNPALSPYKRTSRLGLTTSSWTTACSGSCGVRCRRRACGSNWRSVEIEPLSRFVSRVNPRGALDLGFAADTRHGDGAVAA